MRRDRRVLSVTVHVIRTGPHTLYNRFVRWSRSAFDRIFDALAEEVGARSPDNRATYLKVHRAAASLFEKGLLPRRVGRPVAMLLFEGEMSSAAFLLDALPAAEVLVADRNYYRAALEDKWHHAL